MLQNSFSTDNNITGKLNFDFLNSSSADLDELLKDSLIIIKPSTLVNGKIININKDFVTIDVGYKSQGQVAYSEFLTPDGLFNHKEGDVLEIFVDILENQEGSIVLSKEKATRLKIWDEIKVIHENDGTIVGKISAKVKGGLAVDIGIKGFLPGSQVDLKPTKDLDELVGQNFVLKVLKYDQKRGNVVLSRRAILEVDREERRQKTLEELQEGSRIKGHVKNVTDYGLFIDLGGIDGLLHITDMTWGRISHPSEMYQVGDEIEVMVLSFDTENQKVSLGLKQKDEDPWLNLKDRYKVKDKVKGKVVNITNYGAFIEIEQGVEGLIHSSEISWTKKIKFPNNIFQLGDVVEAAIKEIDFERKRISLSIRDVQHNPWLDISERYPIGSVIEGIVRNVTDFGVFVGAEDGIDGLVHISDVSWSTRNKKKLSEMFVKDQSIKVKLLNIDVEKGRLSLGIKQLTEDPWKNAHNELRIGDELHGKVLHITDFGIFVEIKEGLEGLAHFSEIGKDLTKKQMQEMFPIDSTIAIKIVKVDPTERRLALSVIKDEDLSAEAKTSIDQANETKDSPEKTNNEIKDSVEKTDQEPPVSEETEN